MMPRFSKDSAFSLVEVTLALGIAAFGLIAIFGLLPIGLNSNQTSIEQTVAANLATEIATDLRQAPTANAIATATSAGKTLNPVSPRYGIDVTLSATKGYLDESGALTSGTTMAVSSVTGNSHYQVNVTILAPALASKAATIATLQISWPAAAAPTNAAGSLTTCIALDRN